MKPSELVASCPCVGVVRSVELAAPGAYQLPSRPYHCQQSRINGLCDQVPAVLKQGGECDLENRHCSSCKPLTQAILPIVHLQVNCASAGNIDLTVAPERLLASAFTI
jgi:hypothetical protein